MSDNYEHNIGDHEDPLPGPTWIIGILGAVLLAVVILGVTALFFNADARVVDVKVVDQTYPQFEEMKKAQMARLEGSPRIVEVNENDKIVQSVVIPIDLAMQKIADRSKSAHGSH